MITSRHNNFLHGILPYQELASNSSKSQGAQVGGGRGPQGVDCTSQGSKVEQVLHLLVSGPKGIVKAAQIPVFLAACNASADLVRCCASDRVAPTVASRFAKGAGGLNAKQGLQAPTVHQSFVRVENNKLR
jgi:hypothetical protein